MLQHYRNQQKFVYCANLMFFLFRFSLGGTKFGEGHNSLTHVLVAVTLLTITFRNQCKPVRNHLLTTTSSRPPSAVASCRQGRRQPTADVGRHRFVLSGQAWCPWSAASTPGKCSAEETWAVNEESSCSVFDGLEAWREAKRRVWVRRSLLLPTTSFFSACCILSSLVRSTIFTKSNF